MHSNINDCLKTFIFWKELPKDLIINLKKPLHENINGGSLHFFSFFKKENNSSKELPEQFTCSLLLMCSLCLSSTIFTKQLSFLPFLVKAPLLAPPSRAPSFSPSLSHQCFAAFALIPLTQAVKNLSKSIIYYVNECYI